MNEYRLYLSQLLESTVLIEDFTADGYDVYSNSMLVQAGVMRYLEVIGEATRQLSLELRSRYPEAPWRQIAGLLDVLIHDYMGVDPDEVWNVVVNDLPELKRQVHDAGRSGIGLQLIIRSLRDHP